MEPKLDETSNQNNLLTNFGFLETLLKSHNQPYNKNSMSLDEFFMNLHRIIFSYEDGSKKSYVEKTETFFKLMIKNSIRLKKDSLLFKSVSYFIKENDKIIMDDIGIYLKGKNITEFYENYDKIIAEKNKMKHIILFLNVMFAITFLNSIIFKAFSTSPSLYLNCFSILSGSKISNILS